MNADETKKGSSGLRIAAFAVLALCCAWGAFRFAEIYWDLVSHSDPNHPHLPYLIVAVALGLAAISSAAAFVWNLKKK